VLAGASSRAPKSACIGLNHGFDPVSVILQVYPSRVPYLAPEPLSHPWTRRSTSDPCNWMTLILLRQAYPRFNQHLPIQTTYTPSLFNLSHPFQACLDTILLLGTPFRLNTTTSTPMRYPIPTFNMPHQLSPHMAPMRPPCQTTLSNLECRDLLYNTRISVNPVTLISTRTYPAPWAQRMVEMVAREEGQHLASR
jgi:hypothetical protein